MTDAVSASVYGGPPPPAHFNIAQACLRYQTGASPDKPALVVAHDPADGSADEVWTYARLEDAVLRVSTVLLAMGVKKGDRILLRLGNTAGMAITFLAATAIGAIAIPLSSQLTGADIAFMAEDTEPALIVVASDLPIGDAGRDRRVVEEANLLARAETADRAAYLDTACDDPAYLVYTSGATSRPKGVLHGQRALWGRRPMYAGWYGICATDIVLHAGTLNWTYTLGTGLLDPLVNGATGVVFTGDRRPDIWPALIDRFQATLFAAVPTVYRQILKYCAMSPSAVPTLRHGLAAGEPLRPEIANAWHQATGRRIFEAFGMSEVSTYISTPPTETPRPGSPGRPQDGRAVAILPLEEGTKPIGRGETGLIAVHRSDPALMIGYWNRPDEDPFRGDWFVTGDLAVMDEDGYVWPKGRGDDVMKVMGYRVSAAEVEDVLCAAPGVAEVAVVAIEPRTGVSVIRACVVAQDGAALAPEKVLEFARSRLAAYKVPHEIVVTGALPRTANGKIQRAKLRDPIA
ncbi:acyl-CoA synthetase [Microbaculum marinisediminis]|uniref:AMP-binding protein n=1 Tax=Microbaculum marinisediminis TaxID=2931392 RepID=A0AAW5R5Y0_9HYPH|nr:AMP-binding protein [Microbaculum sp. A6E488]MCT8974086.1 AMP-binding protein [Microbaculum sp. A6E488]